MNSSSFSESRGMNRNDPSQEKSPKKFRSTNTWLEKKKLQNALDETKALLEEERVEKLGQLSQAEWIPSIQVAKVTKQVGRQWMTMGHTYLGDLVLYPEEALFLLETNTIEISYGGLPMSLQQAYSILLGADSSCTLEEYRAYAHLTRYGYRVRRHRSELRPVSGRRGGEDEPLEVDVVGIIRKRKSSDVARAEKLVEVEDTVEVVKRELPHKRSFADVNEPFPSTSGVSSATNLMSSEDDDIKFIEVVDANKKRKVAGTIVINDDVEITSSRVHEVSQPHNQIGTWFNNKKEVLPGRTLISAKQETAIASSDSFGSSPGVELVNNLSTESVNKPSRGMYHNMPLASLSSDTEVPDSRPSASDQHDVTKNTPRKANVQKDETSDAINNKTGNDDVIVLSDDETKEDGEQAREIQRFYKEISLIELIDISEEDEGEKTACQNFNGKDRIADDSYDFWGVLGRIPTLKNGRLIIKIPAPPSNLIPANTRPVKDEYSIDVATSGDKPSEGSSDVARPTEESQRQADEGNNSGSSQQRQNQTQEDSSSHQVALLSAPSSQNQWNTRQSREDSRQEAFVSASSSQNEWNTRQNRQCSSSRQVAFVSASCSQNQWNARQSREDSRHVSVSHWNTSQSRNNSYQHVGNGYQVNSFSGNHYQGNSIRSPWVSLVYPQRQSSYSFTTQFQAWIPQNFSSYYQNSQLLNYSQHQYQNYNVYGDGNRQRPWQNYSNFSNDRGSSTSWQQPSCAPRRGNSQYRRGNNNSFHRRRSWNKPLRATPVEADKNDTSVVPKRPDAHSWAEIKSNGDKQKNTESSDASQSNSKKDILPLLKAADSINIDAVRSKLQITKSAKFSSHDTSNKNTSSLSIKFDLYSPNSNFRKSCPGTPRYRLSVVKSEDNIPNVEDTMYLMKNLKDEVPLLFAVGFTENVNFFSFSNVDLPVQLTK